MSVLFLVAPFYIVGWIAFVAAQRPQDAWEGGVAIFCGLIWPMFFLGWLVSRPYA